MGSAAAQGFKLSRPVDLIVHNGPGSGVDVTARFVNGLLEREKLLPVRAVVVNKPGGNGAVAAAYMTEKKGDAHTLAFFTALWIGSPLTSKESRVQFHELTPIARLIIDPAVIVVKADSPYKTLQDFIEAAKKAPGQLRQAGGSVDSRDNLTRQLLQRATGTSWTYIPFPGGGERVAAVLGGHASLYIADAQEVKEYLRNGSMRILAQMADRRMPAHAATRLRLIQQYVSHLRHGCSNDVGIDRIQPLVLANGAEDLLWRKAFVLGAFLEKDRVTA